MNAFTKIDKATFFALAARSEGRAEFVRGRMQQQSGGTWRHDRIARRWAVAIERRLDPSRWVVNGPDRAIEIGETVRYPDVSVEPEGGDLQSLSTFRPVLIVEVLSPTSEDRDLDVKPAEYMSLATLTAYIVASQDEAACLLWLRGPDGRFPAEPARVRGYEDSIDITALSLVIPLAEVYRGLVANGPDGEFVRS